MRANIAQGYKAGDAAAKRVEQNLIPAMAWCLSSATGFTVTLACDAAGAIRGHFQSAPCPGAQPELIPVSE